MKKIKETFKFGWKIMLLVLITFELILLLNKGFLMLVPQIIIFIGMFVTIFILHIGYHSKMQENE